ncbi:hypothetical protein V6N13_077276 [Hibiscus sabdariffa]|uniref:Glutaredoxin domain-containing protein n=2 Tax=Hibiscus sabdariffa TaxID=183260 RepID=A0ABR2A0I1_9ROSI
MQQAIPYKSWPLPCANMSSRPVSSTVSAARTGKGSGSRDLLGIVSENAVIVLSRKGCCMSHVVRRLLLALGVNPAVCEIDEKDEAGILSELGMMSREKGRPEQFPAVFIGGRLFGGLDKVMATHITGELVPVLKDAGALWL